MAWLVAGTLWGKGISDLAFAPPASEIGKDQQVKFAIGTSYKLESRWQRVAFSAPGRGAAKVRQGEP